MGKAKQIANRRRHEFLLTLFPDQKKEYAEYPINNHVLVRQFNNGTNQWEVAIYTEESFNNKQSFLETHSQVSDDENGLPF